MPKPAALPDTEAIISRCAESLLKRGFAVVPALMDEAERAFACRVHDEILASGRAADSGVFGHGIHPLSSIDPRLCHIFAHPLATAICARALDDRVVLKHTGSRVSDAEQRRLGARIPWHNHQFTPELRQIAPGDPRRGERPRRLLYGWYLDGSTVESGALVALPRRWDDPLAPLSHDHTSPWPGEVLVEAPPGSLILFTIDLWHSATTGTTGGRRRLTGAHIQAASCRDPHPEDHPFEGAAIEQAKREHPGLAALLGDGWDGRA
jgi:hypothetical protein